MTSAPRFLGYARPYSPWLAFSGCCVLAVGALEAVSPFLIGLVFDSVLGASATAAVRIPFLDLPLRASPGDGYALLGALVLATVLKALAEYGVVTSTAFVGQSVVRDLRNDLYENVLVQPLSFFHRNPTGDLISRLSADVERIQTAASETVAELLKQSAILFFLLVAIFVIDWRLSAASLVLAPLVFYPAVVFGKRLRGLSRSNQQQMAEMANLLHETFSGNRIVKAFSMERFEMRRFRDAAQRLFRTGLRQKMTHALSSPLMEILGVFVVAGFLLYARNQIQSGRMTVGLFLAFIISLIKLYDPVRRISGINNSFQQAAGASERVFELLASQPEPDAGRRSLERFEKSIEVANVRFAYDPDPALAVLRGISFSIQRGEMIALVGPSGAGKTTLVNLIPRFYDVTSGEIRIDGVDTREFQLGSLRGMIAVVTQDVILFNDSIRANIAYGKPSASEDEIRAAARAALVDEFVSTLPGGCETQIGERGVRLSGGERQRLSIARAILRNAPILILDEATSSLDAESEVLVQRALDNLMEGRTSIVIAHRLSTVRRADRILVIDEGRIVEAGSHQELVENRGLYWKLYNLQFQDIPS